MGNTYRKKTFMESNNIYESHDNSINRPQKVGNAAKKHRSRGKTELDRRGNQMGSKMATCTNT